MQWIANLFRRRKPAPRVVLKTFEETIDELTLQVRVVEVRPPGYEPDLRVDLWAYHYCADEWWQLTEVSAAHAGQFAALLAKAAEFIRIRRPTITVTWPHKTYTLVVQMERYMHGGGLVVDLVSEDDGEPYTTVSVNLGVSGLADDEFVFKTYSENEGLLEKMLAAGIVEDTGRTAEAGMAGPQPICRLLKR
jgi:hypothetical protein